MTDLHVDYAENMAWCKAIDGEAHRQAPACPRCPQPPAAPAGASGCRVLCLTAPPSSNCYCCCCRNDVLIVSGDVSDELPALEEALSTLAGKFAHLFYVPGNHELWCRESDRHVRRTAGLLAAVWPGVKSGACREWGACHDALGPLPDGEPAQILNACRPVQHHSFPPLLSTTHRAAGIYDSLTKLRRVLELCERLGVHTQPRQLGSLWVVPLFRCGGGLGMAASAAP